MDFINAGRGAPPPTEYISKQKKKKTELNKKH